MVLLTYRRWAHTVVDFGRELYVPWQMVEGQVLYRDLAYLNGPFSPAFNALMFRIFGASLTTVLLVNAAILATIMLLLRRLLRRMTDEWSVLLATAAFVLVFSFGQTNRYANNNFLCPYSHEMTHGLLLGLLSIEAMARFFETRRSRWCAATGLVLGLAFLTKPELFLATLAVCIAGVLIDATSRRMPLSRIARPTLLLLAASAVVPAVAWLALAAYMPARDAADAIVFALRSSVGLRFGQLPFYRTIMGMDDVARSLALIGAGLALSAMIVAVAVVVGYGASRLAAERARMIAAATTCGLVMVLLAVFTEQALWDVAARSLPVIALTVFVVAGIKTVRARRESETWQRCAICVIWSTFSLALMAKILLKAGPEGYGFVLAAPAALLATVAVFDWVPQAISARGVSIVAYRGVVLGAMLVGIGSYVETTHAFAKARTVAVGTGSDRLLARPETAAVVNGLLDAVAREARPTDSLAVLPEGGLLNYLTRRVNPTPHVNVLEGIIVYGENRIAEDFRGHPPDLVAVIPRDLSEYGYDGFGTDFGNTLWAWLHEEYEQVAEVPGADWQGPAILMRHRAR
jgi:4-amino-4-deoxy-L-arabinose transferase-like glycosyltransferase